MKILSVTPVKRREYVTTTSNKPVNLGTKLKPGEFLLVSIHDLPLNNPHGMDLVKPAIEKDRSIRLNFDEPTS